MSKKKSILVIDDDVSLLKTAEELLDIYEVSLAKSGGDALKLLKGGFLPDVILLDVSMPGMDGFETLKRIRNTEIAKEVPVIFLTGLEQTDTELRCLESGAADFVRKPINRDVLLARISARLISGEQLRQLRTLQTHKLRLQIDPDKYERLTRTLTGTERKVISLMAAGCANAEIARELHYSYYYVKKLAAIILDKLDLENRGALRKAFAPDDNPKNSI
ncbi:MAG: response regulator [Clostridiales bacterium]|jgi:DNA-binding response OmpR family regulator|nr:response regulator [Clostridiales bacterium]